MVTSNYSWGEISTPWPHLCTPKTCLRVDPQRGLARGATWGPGRGGVTGVATATYGFFHGQSVGHPDTPLGSTGLPGVGGTWRKTRCERWYYTVIHQKSTERPTISRFWWFSLICRLRAVEFYPQSTPRRYYIWVSKRSSPNSPDV